jgi:hypothetical protein
MVFSIGTQLTIPYLPPHLTYLPPLPVHSPATSEPADTKPVDTKSAGRRKVVPASRLHRTKDWLYRPSWVPGCRVLRRIASLNPSSQGPASRLVSSHASGRQVSHAFVAICGLWAAACGHTDAIAFCNVSRFQVVTMSDVEEQWGFKGFNLDPPPLPPTLRPHQARSLPARLLIFARSTFPSRPQPIAESSPRGVHSLQQARASWSWVCLRDQICTSGDPTASCSPNRSSPDGTRRKIYRCFPRPASALLLPHKPRKRPRRAIGGETASRPHHRA